MTEARSRHVAMHREATLLEEAARIIRRHAGALRYHPTTGLGHPPGAEFTAALERLRSGLARIQTWAGAFEAEEVALGAGVDPALLREVRDAHHRVRRLADLLRAALDVLERTLARPERAPLDAPYGLGTPQRPHPGGQATVVGERAEGLARALIDLILVKENLAGRSRRPGAGPETP